MKIYINFTQTEYKLTELLDSDYFRYNDRLIEEYLFIVKKDNWEEYQEEYEAYMNDDYEVFINSLRFSKYREEVIKEIQEDINVLSRYMTFKILD